MYIYIYVYCESIVASTCVLTSLTGFSPIAPKAQRVSGEGSGGHQVFANLAVVVDHLPEDRLGHLAFCIGFLVSDSCWIGDVHLGENSEGQSAAGDGGVFKWLSL